MFKVLNNRYQKLDFIFRYIFLLYFITFLEASEEKALHHFMQGEFLMNQGNYALAVIEFQDAITYDPNVSTIHISIADAYQRLGKMKRVEDHLKIAMDLDPTDKEAKEMLGQFYISERKYKDAEKTFLDLNKIDSGNLDYIFTLADLFRVQEKWESAIDQYIKGYNVNNQAINGLEQALQIALTTNNFEKGEEICLLLVDENPEEIKLLETLRDISLFTKNYERAYNTIKKIEKISGSSIEILFQKSALQEELDNLTLAMDYMYEAYNKDSLNLDVLNRMVTLLINQDKNDKAIFYNRKIIKNFPDNSKGFINTALMALSRERPEDAIEVLSSNSENFLNDFTFQYLLGTAYYQMKNYLEAITYLKLALDIFPDSRNTKHNLALIYDALDEWEKSDKLYMELITSDSLDAQAYNNYAYSLVEREEDLDFALDLALNAIKISPESAAYLDTVGWIYYKLKRYKKAKEYVEESLKIDSNNVTIQKHYDEILNVRTKIDNIKVQQAEN